MKKTIFLLAFFVIGLCVVGIQLKECEAAEKVVIKAVTSWSINHSGNDNYKEFIKRVNERSKGEIEIKLLGGPEVVPVFDQVKAISTGVVDMCHGAKNYYLGIVPEGIIPELANQKYEVEVIRESGVLEIYTQAHLERGKIFFLGNSQMGQSFYIMTKKPVSNLEDIKGLKLRTMGGLDDMIFGELGASVVKVSSAETYEALQRGIVDGALRSSISLVELKEYEVMKYIVSPQIYGATAGVYVGEKMWNKIPKNLQTLMKEVIKETEVEAHNYYGNLGRASLREAQEKHGMKVISLSDSDITRLNEIRKGSTIKEWIFKKAPKYGPPIYEKVLPYIK